MHAGVPISFADNVALEELSLVIDTDKSENKSVYRLLESVRYSRYFESNLLPSLEINWDSAVPPNRSPNR